ncbi:diaminopimelate epimerase [Bacillus sp. ISL-7]|uniref:diaminopimelate epimerase n=1 Tax=Bacillus sp. ISL-7 TaxID=2819136 RepID=UPI001BE622C4|nr:diaminopimelate epimerase [Bacillus sp. ISL-7]MBT2733509.1 diaminopimelate epimerase [Bacillus sp. ISL-7]
MKEFAFTKMHTLGNNYIYVNMFKELIAEHELASIAVDISNVHTGIGSDGLILICPSTEADLKMRIFNSDGSEAENCGNGLRCVAKYAYENKLVNKENFTIETLSGTVQAHVYVKGTHILEVTINMGRPRFRRKEIPMLGIDQHEVVAEPIRFGNKTYTATLVSMGNPHIIFYVDDIEKAPLTTLGAIVEKDNRFPMGINVGFVQVLNEMELHYRVWERGSGITQACGTGACAAVVASILNSYTSKNMSVTVHLARGDLKITWTEQGDVLMTGCANIVCHGIYYYVT